MHKILNIIMIIALALSSSCFFILLFNGEFETLLLFIIFIISINIYILKRYGKTEGEASDTEDENYSDLLKISFDNSNSGIYLTGLDGNILQVNSRMCEITGFTSEELLKQSTDNLTYPQDWEISHKRIKELIEGKEPEVNFEKRFIHKKGDIVWAQVKCSLIRDRDRNPEYFLTSIQDITEHKKKEMFYIDLFMKAPFAYISIDNKARIVEINSECQRLLGYSRDEATGKWIGSLLKSNDSKSFFKSSFNNLEKGKNLRLELDFVTKGGKSIPVKIEGKVRFDERGHIENTHCVIKDLSQVIEMEREREKTEYLIRQSYKMDSLGTLTGGIAHDFNNILSIIIGNSELALMQISESEPVFEDIVTIKQAGLRASKIVSNLLNFSRKTRQNLKEINLPDALDNSIAIIRKKIPENVIIKKIYKSKDIRIFGDLSQIDRILMNLCKNSHEAMGIDGGNITISLDRISVTGFVTDSIPPMKPGDYIKIKVEDDGKGIDPSISHRIFDPYFTTNDSCSCGMGLSIVLGIVKNHDGSVSFKNKKGKGVEFNVYFPVTDKMDNVENEIKTEDITGNESLLFLDDESPIAEMSKQTLERLGYSVNTFTNPVSALDHFKSDVDNYDLIITDMVMPGMDGLNFTEKVKELRDDIPVILCSGYSSRLEEQSMRREDIASFVRKPFILKDLARTIRNVLED